MVVITPKLEKLELGKLSKMKFIHRNNQYTKIGRYFSMSLAHSETTDIFTIRCILSHSEDYPMERMWSRYGHFSITQCSRKGRF